MQYTTTTANTIQAIINNFFDQLSIDTIEKEIYECFYLSETQSDANALSL